MKKIIFGALAFAVLVACNKNVDVVKPTPAPITFDNSFVEIKTRVAEDPSITTESINAFDVWGFMDNTDVVVFNEVRVTKREEGWKYDNLQYWSPNHEYYFGAIAPVDNKDIKVNTATADKTGLGTVDFTNSNGTVDLIYARKSVKTGDDVITNEPGKVHLQFAHQLSKIKFTFTNGLTNEGLEIAVKDIKMVVPGAGTVVLATGEWTTETNSTVTLDYGHANKAAQFAATESQESDYERFTIPCDNTREYLITFTVEIYNGTTGKLAHTKKMETTLTDQAFKIGKNYNLKATITAENIELKPIEFDVEVKAWEEDTAKEIL